MIEVDVAGVVAIVVAVGIVVVVVVVVVAVVVAAFVVLLFSRLLCQQQQQKGMKSLTNYFPGLTHEPVPENNNVNKMACHSDHKFSPVQVEVKA